MSLCEKVKTYEKEVRESLGVDGYARILNLQYSKDTGQFNVQLQETMESGKKQKGQLKAVVLPEEVSKEISEFLLSKVYPYFEAKQVELLFHEEWGKKQEEIQAAIDKEYSEKSAEIIFATEKTKGNLRAEYGFKVKNLNLESAETLEEYKAGQAAADKMNSEMNNLIAEAEQKQSKTLEDLKISITEKIKGAEEKILNDKIALVKKEYGI